MGVEKMTDNQVVQHALGDLEKLDRTAPSIKKAIEGYAGEHPYQAYNIKSFVERHPVLSAETVRYAAEHPAADMRAEDVLSTYFNLPRLDCPYGNCDKILGAHDIVGTTFYIACNMMLAFTLFFFVQVSVVPKQWKTSVSIAGLVTGIAWYNYTYMKDIWVSTQISPTQFRYTDWLITVPLQITEFYFILKASGPVNPALGSRMFITSVAMVFFGWLGEINVMAKLVAFVVSMACWLYIVYETFSGEAAGYAAKLTSPASKQAFNTLRVIVSLGWSIYPIGYAIAYLCFFDQPAGVLSSYQMAALNIIYNIADLVNKGAFGLCVWSAAISDKENTLMG